MRPIGTGSRTALVTVACLAALTALGWWRLDAAVERHRETQHVETMRVLGDAQSEVERWLRGREDDARLAAGLAHPLLSLSRLAGEGGGVPQAADRAFEQLALATVSLREHAGWTGLWVFDESGELVAKTTNSMPTPRGMRAVRQALGDGRSRRLPPYRTGNVTSLTWVVPVVSSTGKAIRGVVLARANAADAFSRAPQLERGARLDLVAPVDERISVLATRRAPRTPTHLMPPGPSAAFARAALAGPDTFSVIPDERGREVYAGSRKVRGLGWAVVQQTDLRAAYTVIALDLWHELTIASTALLPVLLIALLALRRFRLAREAEVRRSEASYRSFVEHSPFGIYRSTPEGRFTAVNGALVKVLGYPSREALLGVEDIGRQVYLFPAEREQVEAERQADPASPPRDVSWRRRDGRAITVRLDNRPLRDERGAMVGWEGFLEDVTPLRQAEVALRRAEALAAMGRLVSGVAHELSNPITAILHFADELDRNADRGVDEEALTVVRQQAQRCREIVRDLLAMARRREEAREVIDLGPLAERAVLALRPKLIDAGVQVEVSVPREAACVLADRAGLEQVVTNLVSNAADATGAGGRVTVEVRREGSDCVMRVEDDGPGIPVEILPRLFEPFFTTKGEDKGTGLGLPVSLGIVEQHGGRLTAANRVGGGACFTVTFTATTLRPSPPAGHRTPLRAARTSPSGGHAEAGRGGPPRALLIDDEEAVRAAVRRLLELRGWQSDEASSGREAVERFRERHEAGQPYAMVLSDLRMPDMDGAALLTELALIQPDVAGHYVLCTGDPGVHEASLAADLGCRLMEKPFDFATLSRLLDEMAPGEATVS